MKTLEDKILSFNNWSSPWTFYDFVCDEKTLSASEVNLFNEIWTKAGKFELWNDSDLALCSKASQAFILKEYNLKDEVAVNIAKALSYQWK